MNAPLTEKPEAKDATMNTVIEHKPSQVPVRGEAPITPMEMLDRAVSQNANVETLERLLALQERWEATQARKAFDDAMAAAKAEIPTIRKGRTVDFTTSKGRTHYQHEDLAIIMEAVGPILARHGLSVRYRTVNEINQPISVTCIISHRQGHSEENTLVAGRDDSGNKNSIQAIGSTVTYLQRYTLKAGLGLAAAADDDGGKADDEPINEDQVQIILGLIEETGADIVRFCNHLNVASVPEIQASAFKRAVASLEAKKRSGK